MAERTDSRRRGFGDPVPFWLAVLARVFAIIGLPFLIWTSVQLFVEPTKVDFRKATLKLDIRQILLAFILTLESTWAFFFELCYFIPARILSPCLKEFFGEATTTYQFRTLFYFCIPLVLLISTLQLDDSITISHIVSCSLLIPSALCYAYCIFLHFQTGARRLLTLRPPATFK